MEKYRIYRVDKRNIAIQKQRPKGVRWDTISYHGNSAYSLVLGLSELIVAQHIPEQVELLEQLKNLELAIVSSTEEIKKLIGE